MAEDRLERIENKLDALAQDVGILKTDVGILKTDVGTLKVGQVDLRRHMEALHQETLDGIAAVTLGPDFFDRRIDGKVNGLREEINQRLDPIEAALRPRLP